MSTTFDIPPELLPYLTGQLTDNSSLQDTVIKVNIVFIVVVALCAALRMYVRFWLLRCHGMDDALMIIALVCAYVLFGSCLAGYHLGLGKHIWNLDPNLLKLPEIVGNITKLLYVSHLSYATAIAFTKLSIIMSYLRIFPNKWLRALLLADGFIVLSFWIASTFAVIFTCVPVQAAWDYTIRDAKCFDVVDFFYVATAFNILTDVILCVSPMPLLWAMNLPLKQRFIICILFGLGLFACISSVLRMTQLHLLGGVDISYQSVTSLNWSVAEVGTALVCASLASMRPLASKLFPKMFSEYSAKRSAYPAPTQAKSDMQENKGSLPSVDHRSIHVQHTFEFDELRIPLPENNGRVSEFESAYGVPLSPGKSSKEELVKQNLSQAFYRR